MIKIEVACDKSSCRVSLAGVAAVKGERAEDSRGHSADLGRGITSAGLSHSLRSTIVSS